MEPITLYINGAPVQALPGQTVLEAALAAGFYIPHLCAHPDLLPQGGCKLCVVEVDSAQPVTACTTPVRDGMRVVTRSEGLERLRRTAMEFVLAGHPGDCTGCRSYGSCELQATMQYLSVTPARMRTIHRTTTGINTKNPLIDREMERCIQCGRCVRACQDLRGVGILDYRKKDGEVYVGTEGELTLAGADCRFCGACVEVCPTGALQDREGVFRKDLPREQAMVPCRAECPAHIDIPRYVRLVGEGRYAEAVAVIREKVPFPHALGHVCNHVCEGGCKREGLNEAVSIRNLKRYAVEHDTQQLWKARSVHRPATGKRVAVVGSGPAGLTGAYYLAKQGHAVTVLERLPVAGGMLTTGIPAYRLPRADTAAEIAEICAAGVSIETSREVTSLSELSDYDAVLVAVGASAGKTLPLPGCTPDRVTTAVELLRAVSLEGAAPRLGAGKRVAVLGGGNVAFDAARVSRRMGAEVCVICLEARVDMLADREEIQQAEEEGIRVYAGKTNLALEDGGVRVIDAASFRFEGGRLLVETVPDTEQVIPADLVVFATGQRVDLADAFGLERNSFGYLDCQGSATAVPGVYVAGDVVTGTKSVICAIEAGRQAASDLDRWLGGDGKIEECLVEPERPEPRIGKREGFAGLERNIPAVLEPLRRADSFDLADLGLDDAQAVQEAGRCLACDLRCQLSRPKLWSAYTDR